MSGENKNSSNSRKLFASGCNSVSMVQENENFDNRKKIKHGKSSETTAWGIFSDYCDNSTIHGIKYFGDKERPFLERLFWILMFLASIIMCGKMILNTYHKWTQTPVIVSFAEKSTPVIQIPFPAVTVCIETKSRRSVFNFTELFWVFTNGTQNNTSDEEMNYMEAVSQVCSADQVYDFSFNNELTNNSIITRLESAAPIFDETFIKCKYLNNVVNCSRIMRKMLTEDGICYTFNLMSPSEIFREESIQSTYGKYVEERKSQWKLEKGYDSDVSTEAYPERVHGSGSRSGLFLLLQGNDDDYDSICRGPTQGFKISLHTPAEIPLVSQQYFRIPFGQEVIISVKPNMMITSSGLLGYSPERRQCFFQNERYLRYFHVYTQANCELECLANYTLKECNCVKFSMPRNSDAPICGAAKILCYYNAELSLLADEFVTESKSSNDTRLVDECNCLPACTSIDYDAELSQAEFESKHSNNYERIKQDNPAINYARVSIIFKETEFITSKRSELYGTTDFLANCGGLLALFMGVSLLSLVEIIYFCTVRLGCNLKMQREKKQKLAKRKKQVPPQIIVKDSSM